MTKIFIPLIFLCLYSFFNLLGINSNLAKSQFIYIIIGFILLFLIKKINQAFFFDNAKFFYWFFVFVLVITYIIGLEVKGSKRWLDFYFFRFQSSEILKVFFIIYLSVFLAKSKKNVNLLIVFIKSLIYLLIPLLVIFKQPDLANGLIYLFIYFVMMIFSLVPKKYLLSLFIIIMIMLPLFWQFLKPYQKQRIVSFINPQLRYQYSSYNMVQSIIAIGSGKVFGRGLGYGTQAKLQFLPERTTDFAFASLVEQFGFISGAIVIFLYFYLIYLLLKNVNKEISNSKGISLEKSYFMIGLISYIFFQVMVNIGMNLGLLPVAGVALPIISYGGSAVITFFLGLIISSAT